MGKKGNLLWNLPRKAHRTIVLSRSAQLRLRHVTVGKGSLASICALIDTAQKATVLIGDRGILTHEIKVLGNDGVAARAKHIDSLPRHFASIIRENLFTGMNPRVTARGSAKSEGIAVADVVKGAPEHARGFCGRTRVVRSRHLQTGVLA